MTRGLATEGLASAEEPIDQDDRDDDEIDNGDVVHV